MCEKGSNNVSCLRRLLMRGSAFFRRYAKTSRAADDDAEERKCGGLVRSGGAYRDCVCVMLEPGWVA